MSGAPFPHGETVTRLRGSSVVSPYSGQATKIDWSNPNELVIEGCGFNPGGSVEPTEAGRNAVISQPEVYLPSDADVTAKDRLEVRGITYEVDGAPTAWVSPFTGWAPGTVAKLKVVEG